MSGMRGSYAKNKMKVTVSGYRNTIGGARRRLTTHVFVKIGTTGDELFNVVRNKYPEWTFTDMWVGNIRSRERVTPRSLGWEDFTATRKV